MQNTITIAKDLSPLLASKLVKYLNIRFTDVLPSPVIEDRAGNIMVSKEIDPCNIDILLDTIADFSAGYHFI